MNTEQFERLLTRYGADLAYWPWPQRCAAGRLLSGSVAARRALAQAHRTDRLLGRALQAQAMPAELLRKLDMIPEQFPRAATRPPREIQERRLYRRGAAWALACGVAGLAVGATGWFSPAEDTALAELAMGGAELGVGIFGDAP